MPRRGVCVLTMNGHSTYIEFDDSDGTVALHLPKDQADGPLMELAALLFFALKDEECSDFIEEIREIVLSEMVGRDDPATTPTKGD